MRERSTTNRVNVYIPLEYNQVFCVNKTVKPITIQRGRCVCVSRVYIEFMLVSNVLTERRNGNG